MIKSLLTGLFISPLSLHQCSRSFTKNVCNFYTKLNAFYLAKEHYLHRKMVELEEGKGDKPNDNENGEA